MSPKKLDSDTSVKLTAFSINSMHRKIVMALRLMKTPTAPMVNSSAESPKYHDNGIIITPKPENSGKRFKLTNPPRAAQAPSPRLRPSVSTQKLPRKGAGNL